MAVDADTPGKLTPADDEVGYDAEGDRENRVVTTPRRTPSPLLLAGIAGLVAVIALGGLSAWLGLRANESQHMQAEREVFLQVAKQGALNLTTIDYQHADADIQRILDSATGQFHEDFAQRSKPFVDVVQKAKSTSQGTITAAGLESSNSDEAQAIVAVSVKTIVAGAPDEQPRSWRMQLTMQRLGADIKISKVGFVA